MAEDAQFIKAFDEYADGIFRYCYFRVFNRERAKDLTQEAFMRAWEYVSKGNKIGNLRAFLYKIAHNLIVDESRKMKEYSLEALSEQGFDPPAEGGQVRDIEAKEVRALVAELGEEYREAVHMRHIEGFSPKEIAQIIGESENVVSVRIHRGLAKLRTLLYNKKKDG